MSIFAGKILISTGGIDSLAMRFYNCNTSRYIS